MATSRESAILTAHLQAILMYNYSRPFGKNIRIFSTDHLVNPDVEQGGVGGTYAPPNVPEGAGVNPSAPASASGPTATVIVIPSPATAAIVSGEGSISSPSVDLRSVPTSTPAPDFQADGGID